MVGGEKQQQRAQASRLVEEMSWERRHSASELLRRHLLGWEKFRQACCVAGFVPLHDEPDWAGAQLPPDKCWLFPRVEPEGRLAWVEVKSWGDLAPGAFGILEPKGKEILCPTPDLVLIPGRAFDREGWRLGRGKGYYDRALPKLPGLRVGVAFACQIFELVARESGDEPVDAVLTENGLSIGGKANRRVAIGQ